MHLSIVRLALASLVARQEPPGAPAAGRDTGWSPPARLALVRHRGAVAPIARAPSVATDGPETYVAGMDLQRLDRAVDERGMHAKLFAWRSGIGLLGQPHGSHSFAFPRIVVDRAHTLHLLWAESNEQVYSYPDFVSHLQRLLWSTYRQGAGWSAATEILTARNLWWGAGSVGAAAVDARNGLHVIVTVDTGGARTLVHLVRRRRQWLRSAVPPAAAAYESLAATPSGRLYLAIIAPDTSAPPDVNSVWISDSPDLGATWSAGRLVSRSGIRQASEIAAFASSDTLVDLVWGQNLSGGAPPEVIRHVRSLDAGQSWSAPDDVRPTAGFRRLSAARSPSSDGWITIVYEDWNGGGTAGDIDEVRWRNGWAEPRHLFPGLVSLSPALHAADSGTLELVWLAAAGAATLETPLVTMVARRNPSPALHPTLTTRRTDR